MEVLLTDITELKYADKCKAYLSAILDYGTGKIVAYKLSKRNDNQLVKDTVVQIEGDLIPRKTLIHSDRGCQYISHFFKRVIDAHQLIQRMSRVGMCIDNGQMESFWGTLKVEMYRLRSYETLSFIIQIGLHSKWA